MPPEDDPVELDRPDIAPYRAGNTGIDYATTLDSGRPGPHVMISALVHGNELCGAIALDSLFRLGVQPVRGRLSLAFMNVAAYQSYDPDRPAAARFVDEDFNRVWSAEALDGGRNSVERRRARALRPLIDTVDLLLDIHSMQHATPPLLLAGPLAKGRGLARQVGTPEIVVSDRGHAAGTRLRDYGAFADPRSAKTALLVECGRHGTRRSAEVALETALRFLVSTGTVDPAWAAPHLSGTRPPAQRFIEVSGPVTIRTERFRFAGDYRGLEVVARAGTVIGYDGAEPVATPYDECVLVMPSRRLRRGETAVRFGRYVAP